MGGVGSGRTPENPLSTSFRQLTVRSVDDAGGLRPGAVTTWHWTEKGQIVTFARICAEESGLRVRYSWWSASLDWIRSDWFIRVERSDCHYGGSRPWLMCPMTGCHRRMYVFYGDKQIGCRRCRHFSYPSQRVTPKDRALYRAQSIRQKLGGSPDISLPFPPRPSGMPSFAYTKLGLRAHRAEMEDNAQLLRFYEEVQQRSRRNVLPPIELRALAPERSGVQQ